MRGAATKTKRAAEETSASPSHTDPISPQSPNERRATKRKRRKKKGKF